MKKMIAMVTVFLLVMAGMSFAESVPFSEWIEGQQAVAEQAVVQDVPLVAEGEPLTPAPEAFSPIGVGSRGDDVLRLQTKLTELGFLNGKADGIFGAGTEAALKAVQKALGWEETGVIQTVDELNTILFLVPGDGVNLAIGTSSEWSEWMTPELGTENSCFNVAYAYLGDRAVGDIIVCQVEIEFSNVTQESEGEKPFAFYSQGAVDGAWDIGNVWRPSLVRLDTPPEDGTYSYVLSTSIDEAMVNAYQFNIGFRCDYWASGSFRVRNIKVERGKMATAWSAAPLDIGDGINLALGTNSNWSEWMTPELNENNQTFNFSSVDLPNKVVGQSYTCQFEIEFSNVSASASNDGECIFAFKTQGPVDGAWEVSNIWNWPFVTLSEAPANGVYKFTKTVRITENNVNATHFDLGFRCDYWASGSFRVRNIKVERGTVATEWTPGL